MSFLQFDQRHMHCWYLYIFYANPFVVVVVSSSMGRCSIQYVIYFPLSGIFGTFKYLIIRIHFFQKSIKISSVLRKNFIAIHAFTSVNAMKKANTWMGHQVVPHSI